MNRTELVDAVGERLGDRRTAAAAVEAVLDTVTGALSEGEKVALFGFGVFERVERAARTARNPATGGTVEVPATAVPRFRPGQALKDAVNGRTSGSTSRSRPPSRTVTSRSGADAARADAEAVGTQVGKAGGTSAAGEQEAAGTVKGSAKQKSDGGKAAERSDGGKAAKKSDGGKAAKKATGKADKAGKAGKKATGKKGTRAAAG